MPRAAGGEQGAKAAKSDEESAEHGQVETTAAGGDATTADLETEGAGVDRRPGLVADDYRDRPAAAGRQHADVGDLAAGAEGEAPVMAAAAAPAKPATKKARSGSKPARG